MIFLRSLNPTGFTKPINLANEMSDLMSKQVRRTCGSE